MKNILGENVYENKRYLSFEKQLLELFENKHTYVRKEIEKELQETVQGYLSEISKKEEKNISSEEAGRNLIPLEEVKNLRTRKVIEKRGGVATDLVGVLNSVFIEKNQINEYILEEEIPKRPGLPEGKHLILKEQILPPDELERGEGTGGYKENEKLNTGVNKVGFVQEIIKGRGVKEEEIYYVSGKVEKGGYRKQSYLVMMIPKLNITLMVNNQYGQGIYALNFLPSTEELFSTTKKTWKYGYGGMMIARDYKRPMNVREEIELWKQMVVKAREESEDGENTNKETKERKNNFDKKLNPEKRDREYYMNKEKVRYDLEAYAKAMSKGVKELNASRKCNAISIECSNGEEVNWNRYILKAVKELGVTESRGEMVKYLQEVAGYEVKRIEEKRDREYYMNGEKVRYDLELFAKAMGRNVKELSTSPKYRSITIECSNGEEVNWDRYIKNAIKELGIIESLSEMVKYLQEVAGYEVKRIEEKRDREYYMNGEKVRYDLELFAKAMGRNAKELNTSPKYNSITVECSNGEEVNWDRYIKNAIKELGIIESLSEMVKYLQEVAGYEVKRIEEKRDREYYMNGEKVRYDLESFAKAMGRNVKELSTSPKYNTITIECSNGEEVKWQRYIRKAVKELGVTESRGEMVKYLQEVAGYEVKRIEEKRDREYYMNKEKVRYDLEAYAKAMSKGVKELNASRKCNAISIECSNGEEVNWNRYIRKAVKELGVTESRGEMVKYLQEVAGYEVKRIEEKRDREYYNNKEKVRYDLEKYAKAMGKKIEKLNTSNGNISTECSNGEEVSWQRYINNAMKELKVTESRGEMVKYLIKFVQ